MMGKYFLHDDGKMEEVMVETPVNPLGLPIVELQIDGAMLSRARFVGGVLSYVDEDVDALAEDARDQRDVLMRETDWMVLPDSPLSADDRDKALAYRQALRDVPAQPGFPVDIVWPVLDIAHAKR